MTMTTPALTTAQKREALHEDYARQMDRAQEAFDATRLQMYDDLKERLLLLTDSRSKQKAAINSALTEGRTERRLVLSDAFRGDVIVIPDYSADDRGRAYIVKYASPDDVCLTGRAGTYDWTYLSLCGRGAYYIWKCPAQTAGEGAEAKEAE